MVDRNSGAGYVAPGRRHAFKLAFVGPAVTPPHGDPLASREQLIDLEPAVRKRVAILLDEVLVGLQPLGSVDGIVVHVIRSEQLGDRVKFPFVPYFLDDTTGDCLVFLGHTGSFLLLSSQRDPNVDRIRPGELRYTPRWSERPRFLHC